MRRLTSSPLSSNVIPPPRRDTTALPCFLHLVLPVLLLLASRLCEAQLNPSDAGLTTASADAQSTSLPRLLCVSCGSGVRFWKHLHGAGRGEYISGKGCSAQKAAANVKGTKAEVHYINLRRNFPLGRGDAAPRSPRVDLEVVLFSAVWGLSLLSVLGHTPLYRMRRPTARIAWTAQPMRPPQRDRDAESPALLTRHYGECGKPASLQQGSSVSSSS